MLRGDRTLENTEGCRQQWAQHPLLKPASKQDVEYCLVLTVEQFKSGFEYGRVVVLTVIGSGL